MNADGRVAFAIGTGDASTAAICLVVCAPHVRCPRRSPRHARKYSKLTPSARSQVAALARWREPLLSRARGVRKVALELAVDVLPFCIASICSDSPPQLLLLYLLLLSPAALPISAPAESPLDADADDAALLRELNAARVPALTRLRGSVALQTAFCILAVDFAIFPRSAAKTHTYGRSVMDLGVGAVVLVGALSRRRPQRCDRGESPPSSSSSTTTSTASSGRAALATAARALVRHLPLVGLGVGRLVAVRATAYHEVHSEYGVHWNFFFTLALVAAGGGLVEAVRAPALGDAARGACVLAAHQAALALGGAAWVVGEGPRATLLAANREGLVSLPGYLALSLLGGALRTALAPKPSLREWRAAVRRLAGLDAVLWAAAAAADAALQPTSRRLCNAAYVLWVLAQVTLVLCLCLAVSLRGGGGASRRRRPPPPPTARAAAERERAHVGERDGPPPPPSGSLLDAVSSRPLLTFLLANVLTGGVNLTMPTTEASAAVAAGVLAAYMGLVCAAPFLGESWVL